MRKVTWPELFSNTPAINYEAIFHGWAPRIMFDYAIAPIGMSAFGCIFFARRDGMVECLDPLQGAVRQVASDAADFRNKMNMEAWQIENLHLNQVAQIVETLPRGPTQAYALAPHPNFTDGILSLERSQILVVDAEIWHSISAQSF